MSFLKTRQTKKQKSKTPSTSHFQDIYLLTLHSGLCCTYPMCLMKLCKLVPNPSMLKLLESWRRLDSPLTHWLFALVKRRWFSFQKVLSIICYTWNKSFPLFRTIHIHPPRCCDKEDMGKCKDSVRVEEELGFGSSGNLESYTVSHWM